MKRLILVAALMSMAFYGCVLLTVKTLAAEKAPMPDVSEMVNTFPRHPLGYCGENGRYSWVFVEGWDIPGHENDEVVHVVLYFAGQYPKEMDVPFAATVREYGQPKESTVLYLDVDYNGEATVLPMDNAPKMCDTALKTLTRKTT